MTSRQLKLALIGAIVATVFGLIVTLMSPLPVGAAPPVGYRKVQVTHVLLWSNKYHPRYWSAEVDGVSMLVFPVSKNIRDLADGGYFALGFNTNYYRIERVAPLEENELVPLP